MRPYNIESYEIKAAQAAFGAQDWLRFGLTVSPALQSGDAPWPSFGSGTYDLLQGERVIDLNTTVSGQPSTILPALGPGTYYSAFLMNGMASINVYLKFTFSGGTLTANAFTTYKDHFSQSQAFTGNGALTTGTQAVLTLATPKGEQIGLLQLVVGSGGSVTACTQAEFSGQRG